MVYKKIRNNIPSLSSLLLAGVLLGSNCTDKKNTENVAGGQTGENAQNVAEGEKPKDASGKPLTQDYIKVVKDIYHYLISIAGIERLGNRVYQVNPSDFTGANAKDNLNNLCNSFSNAPWSQVYPIDPELQTVFQSLVGMEFRSARSMKGIRHKYAFGCALTEIIDVWSKFSDIYKDTVKYTHQGALSSNMTDLLHKLDKYYAELELDTVNSKFSAHRKFFDSNDVEFLTKDRLGRFLTGKTINDEDKTHHVADALKVSLGPVWVMGKAVDDVNLTEALDNVKHRGCAISKKWRIQGETQSPAPEIPVFPISSKITKDFKDGMVLDLPSDQSYKDILTAPVKQDLQCGHLLTTLFNGDVSSVDFIKFEPHETAVSQDIPWIQLEGNNTTFRILADQATNFQTGVFVTTLAQHINNGKTGLSKLYCIPDITSIENSILEGIKDKSEESVNKESTYQSGEIKLEHIAGGSNASKLLVNLGKIFGLVHVNVNKEFFDSLSALLSNEDFLTSSATIEQKIAFVILKKLFDYQSGLEGSNAAPILVSKNSGSVKDLIELVQSEIKREANYAVLYKEEDKYQPTHVTQKIANFITSIHKKLQEKRGHAYVTYKGISDTSKSKAFNIETVVKAIKKDYSSIRGILTARVEALVKEESFKLTNENFKRYFPGQPLNSPHVNHINNMKTEYINKNKSQNNA
ncbi:hypothetical protein ACRRVB_00150 [Candidatus Cardinium hertigii]|uniref:hypothetical protein n=1 Tax=Candidatus Cardinium hertigii TaxID=247481 RepID=UPI003D7EB56F